MVGYMGRCKLKRLEEKAKRAGSNKQISWKPAGPYRQETEALKKERRKMVGLRDIRQGWGVSLWSGSPRSRPISTAWGQIKMGRMMNSEVQALGQVRTTISRIMIKTGGSWASFILLDQRQGWPQGLGHLFEGGAYVTSNGRRYIILQPSYVPVSLAWAHLILVAL